MRKVRAQLQRAEQFRWTEEVVHAKLRDRGERKADEVAEKARLLENLEVWSSALACPEMRAEMSAPLRFLRFRMRRRLASEGTWSAWPGSRRSLRRSRRA